MPFLYKAFTMSRVLTPGQEFFDRAWPYKAWSENALILSKSSSILPGIDQTN